MSSDILKDNFHRLRYAAFIGQAYPYFFVETAKVACTTLKYVLLEIEGRSLENAMQVGEESARAMAIHYKDFNNFKSFSDFTTEQQLYYLTSGDVTRFCCVRNPYARIASAWTDKIRLKEPGFIKYWNNINQFNKISDSAHCPTFSEFIRWIKFNENIQTCDAHWRSMSSLVMFKSINYTFIMRLETLSEDLQNVLNVLNVKIDATEVINRNTRNESLPYDWRSLYNKEIAQNVYDLYINDFTNFSYKKDSWKPKFNKGKEDDGDCWKQKYQRLEQRSISIARQKNEAIADLIQVRNFLVEHCKD